MPAGTVTPHLSFFFMLLAALFCAAISARADVNVIQALYFGEWIVTDNSGTRTITLGADGSYSHSPALILLQVPREGVFDIGGLTPNTAISSVTVTQVQALDAGPGEEFAMDNFTVDAPASTDGSGRATVSIGGRVLTSGNGGSYPDATYTGTLEIEINL